MNHSSRAKSRTPLHGQKKKARFGRMLCSTWQSLRSAIVSKELCLWRSWQRNYFPDQFGSETDLIHAQKCLPYSVGCKNTQPGSRGIHRVEKLVVGYFLGS